MILPSFAAPASRTLHHPHLDEALARLPPAAIAQELSAHHLAPLYPPRPAPVLLAALHRHQTSDFSALDWLRLVQHVVEGDDAQGLKQLVAVATTETLPCVLLLQHAVAGIGRKDHVGKVWKRFVDGEVPAPPLKHPLLVLHAAWSVRSKQKRIELPAIGLQTLFARVHCPLPRASRTQLLTRLATRPDAPTSRTWWAVQLEHISGSERVAVLEVLFANPRVTSLEGKAPFARCLVSAAAPVLVQLSAEARRVLHGWQGQALYTDFRRLADRIHKKNPSNYHLHRLKSRALFWSIYQNQVVRRRILVPRDTASSMGNTALGEGVEVSEISAIPNQRTEVCIFEFESCIVVELFRGDPGETRVFEPTSSAKALLEEGKRFDLEHVRCMPGATVLDHVVGWQAHATHELARCGLRPDPAVRRIPTWVKRRQCESNFPLGSDGLGPMPEGKKARDRLQNLRQFHQDVQRMESLARKKTRSRRSRKE